MPSIIFILLSANKNDSWKICARPSLSYIWKLAKTIPNVWKMEPSIFQALTLVWQVLKPSFNENAGVMTLILLPESSKACTSAEFFQKQSG